jgi:ADP-ribose pyrophosphatase YjhB (NUDIX family)
VTDLPRHVVVVLVFIRQGDHILLVRQNYGRRYWSLPGGVMELGESIDEAAIREVKEETGLDVRLTRIVGLYSKPGEEALAVTFEAEIVGGTLHADHEISECSFFPVDQLPQPIREHLRDRVADFSQGQLSAVVRAQ